LKYANDLIRLDRGAKQLELFRSTATWQRTSFHIACLSAVERSIGANCSSCSNVS